MGFLDGISKDFKGSTFEIAKLLQLPTVFILDAKASAQSIIIPIKGIEWIKKYIPVIGIILNNVSTEGHKKLLIEAITKHSKINILGVLPKYGKEIFFSRHLGLQTAIELDKNIFNDLSAFVEQNINIDKILALAKIDINYSFVKKENRKKKTTKKIGYIAYDKAFNFYYRSNIEYLMELGYNIKYFSPLENETIEKCDFLYIGGGYPELYAKRLQDNTNTIDSIIEHFHRGGKIIAECGGLIYLSKSITNDNTTYNMINIFDTNFKMENKIQALGYVEAEINKNLPFYEKGKKIKGHIFHYSSIISNNEEYIFKLKTLSTNKIIYDGFFKNATLASYTHFHFLDESSLIEKFLQWRC